MGRSFETDSELVLPAHPRVIPELLIVPVERTVCSLPVRKACRSFADAARGSYFRGCCRCSMGTRTQDDVRALVPGLTAEGLRNIVSPPGQLRADGGRCRGRR